MEMPELNEEVMDAGEPGEVLTEVGEEGEVLPEEQATEPG